MDVPSKPGSRSHKPDSKTRRKTSLKPSKEASLRVARTGARDDDEVLTAKVNLNKAKNWELVDRVDGRVIKVTTHGKDHDRLHLDELENPKRPDSKKGSRSPSPQPRARAAGTGKTVSKAQQKREAEQERQRQQEEDKKDEMVFIVEEEVLCERHRETDVFLSRDGANRRYGCHCRGCREVLNGYADEHERNRQNKRYELVKEFK